MTYFLTILFPPIGLLIAGKPIQAILNFFLYLCFIIPSYIHAFAVIKDKKADKRIEQQTKALLNARKEQMQ
jgi:uncharacterized membrane protein YqaE (UPF0057 family)